MRQINILKSALHREGFTVFQRPFELNIVGLRADTTEPNRFDDAMVVFYRDDAGAWQIHVWPITTDPGTYWLNSPMHPQGTAILKGNAQYRNAYSIGLHQGKYPALVQRLAPVTVLRDYNRDAKLDFINGYEDTGMFGINIHRAASSGTTKVVQKYSAGCQVFANAEDFDRFMKLCEVHRQRYGNAFTYTLFDQRAIKRAKKRRTAGAVAGVGVALVGGYKLWQWLRSLE